MNKFLIFSQILLRINFCLNYSFRNISSFNFIRYKFRKIVFHIIWRFFSNKRKFFFWWNIWIINLELCFRVLNFHFWRVCLIFLIKERKRCLRLRQSKILLWLLKLWHSLILRFQILSWLYLLIRREICKRIALRIKWIILLNIIRIIYWVLLWHC